MLFKFSRSVAKTKRTKKHKQRSSPITIDFLRFYHIIRNQYQYVPWARTTRGPTGIVVDVEENKKNGVVVELVVVVADPAISF